MNALLVISAIFSCYLCLVQAAPTCTLEPRDVIGDIYSNKDMFITDKSSSAVNPRNCMDIYNSGHRESGIYVINVGSGISSSSKRVYCDMTLPGGGWTVILKRRDTESKDRVSFDRTWEEYTGGFGYFTSEFWMGLSFMNQLTRNQDMELFIGLQSHDDVGFKTTNCDVYRFAKYSRFNVGDANSNYMLTIGGYDADQSTAGDALSTGHNNVPFSTKDEDNDKHKDSKVNCAERYNAGWWYNSCHDSHLTGIWREKSQDSSDGIQWNTWQGNHKEEMKSVVMAIRPRSK